MKRLLVGRNRLFQIPFHGLRFGEIDQHVDVAGSRLAERQQFGKRVVRLLHVQKEDRFVEAHLLKKFLRKFRLLTGLFRLLELRGGVFELPFLHQNHAI